MILRGTSSHLSLGNSEFSPLILTEFDLDIFTLPLAKFGNLNGRKT